MKTFKRLASMLLAGVLVLGAVPARADEAVGLTRGETARRLLEAGFKYTPELQLTDIVKGYPNGELDLDGPVTRAQALVMLDRAFGGLPAPVGDSARTAIPADSFSDVPDWAAEELERVLAAGIVAGTGDGHLSPDRSITAEELDTLIRRTCALMGTDRRDDFYAAINKTWLDSSTIPAGMSINGPFYGLTYHVADQVAELIADIAATPQTPGTAEARIAALYHTVTDLEGREAQGVAPIQTYLDAIESARTVNELASADCRMQEELGLSVLLGFGLTTDLADSTRYIPAFSAFSCGMSKDFYTSGTEEQTACYLDYLATLLELTGLSEADAAAQAQMVYEAEAAVAAASLDPQEYGDVAKIYNLYTLQELWDVFPGVDLENVYAASGLKRADAILVTDVGAMNAAAKYFTQENLDTLKAVARLDLAASVGGCLGRGFTDAAYDFQAACYGIEGRQTTEELAAAQVQSLLSDYLARAYAETCFSPEAKADVEDMVNDFIAIYKERILALDWMSEETKQMAVKKLDAMGVKVGYPDDWTTCLDSADLRSPAEGGTFFSNVIAIQKAAKADLLSRQDEPVDKTRWIMSADTVNACYSATANDITFPAAILQSPMYDVNASREENLGAIGYIIAHEITHAFDNNGAKFDENGNAANWWTDADYAAFQEKCQAVVTWYDGQEAIPGVTCSGTLTLSENVADLGAAACVVEAASRLEDPDYDALFRSMARTWASTTSRQMRQYLSAADVHAPDKLRVNRVLQTIDLFYETYDIHPGDGMWTDPEGRVSVW